MAGRSHVLWRRSLLLVALAAVAPGCDALTETTASSSSTLVPLPTLTTVAPSTSTSTAASGPESTVAATTTLAEQPVGEWDGATFDVGRIASVGTTDDGGYVTIDFDRYSYLDPFLGAIDAAALQQEPLPVWWRDEPWTNNNPGTRQFVLTPGVEVLTLSAAGMAAACAEPAPEPVPTPVWVAASPSALEGLATDAPLALLTFAPTGPVTRIRFTNGC